MELEALKDGVARYGTPLYIFDTDEMRDTVLKFRRILGEKAGLCFAMKANPFLAERMAHEADRIEVCSMGEFRICRAYGIPPEKLLISGVLKKEEDICEILETCRGRCTYTAESKNQLKCLEEWCRTKGEELRVYLRLTSGNQFGMDRADIEEILVNRDTQSPHLNIQGIHYFSGTQKKRMEKVKEELTYLDRFLGELEEKTKVRIEELEYGPGLAVSYFEGQKDTGESDIYALVKVIDKMQWKGSVTLEMGRALAAECGYYLTRVRDTKHNAGRNYCIVDGGIHQMNYDGQIRGMYQPQCQIIPECETKETEEWTVCGSLCTTNDVLMQNMNAGGLKTGSILIFERAGAYSITEGMALFLSHELPAAICYSRDTGWKQMRRELQTYKWNMEEK